MVVPAPAGRGDVQLRAVHYQGSGSTAGARSEDLAHSRDLGTRGEPADASAAEGARSSCFAWPLGLRLLTRLRPAFHLQLPVSGGAWRSGVPPHRSAAISQLPRQSQLSTLCGRGCEMHGRGAILVFLRQAHAGAAHLVRGQGRHRAPAPYPCPCPKGLGGPASPGPRPDVSPEPGLSHTTTPDKGLTCAAACSGVMPSGRLRCGSASNFLQPRVPQATL